MDSKEFDDWYEKEIEEIESKLPNPYGYSLPTIKFFINFSELRFLEIPTDDMIYDKIKLHTIEFEKKYNKNHVVWERIR